MTPGLISHPPGVVVVLVNWNGYEDSSKCLRSLRKQTYVNCRVVVVDNGSTDGSVKRLRQEFPEVEVLETGRNLGFSKGNNVGINRALGWNPDYVWVLNNDTTVDPNALVEMVRVGEDDRRIGAVGSVLYSMDEPGRVTVWGGGWVSLLRGTSGCYSNGPITPDFVSGASMLLRRAALDEVGAFDEGFFIYWEDADLSFRLRKRGWRLGVAEASRVWHKESVTFGKRSVARDTIMNRSAIRFLFLHARVPWCGVVVGIGGRIGKRLLAGDWGRARAVWNGAAAGLRARHEDGGIDHGRSTG